ncbi:hypothetical protein AKJ41_03040, partial [candidate division MSBL1 archaeon SCGC-AAA259O05]
MNELKDLTDYRNVVGEEKISEIYRKASALSEKKQHFLRENNRKNVRDVPVKRRSFKFFLVSELVEKVYDVFFIKKFHNCLSRVPILSEAEP